MDIASTKQNFLTLHTDNNGALRKDFLKANLDYIGVAFGVPQLRYNNRIDGN
jgi:hypothetical protein